MYTIKVACIAVALAGITWLAAWIMDRARPEPPVPESYYPVVGQVLHSKAEGFSSRVIKTDSENTWLELTMAPHAAGPPVHIHTTFAEDFAVARGTLSLRVGGEIVLVGPGEHYRVPTGVPHQPFNATDDEVIVRGPLTPQYALPRGFVLFLSQMYGFMDEAPAHKRPPALIFQISLLGPKYDSWLAAPPVALQRFQYALIRPIARLLGYQTCYARYAPQPIPQPN
jgi:mannose-6-phosphate isomerase-like protein (cupin superfamily)